MLKILQELLCISIPTGAIQAHSNPCERKMAIMPCLEKSHLGLPFKGPSILRGFTDKQATVINTQKSPIHKGIRSHQHRQ